MLANTRTSLRTITVILVFALLAACGDRRGAGRTEQNGIEFGIWMPDSRGELQFQPTLEVPYVDQQAFGWRLKGAVPEQPVQWVERLQLSAAPGSWEGVLESPNVTVSDDGRTATTFGMSVPEDDFVGNVWYVSAGDPMGDCRIWVEFADGRKASFRFTIAAPKDGRPAASAGEVI
jgi:predicted small secreted protein